MPRNNAAATLRRALAAVGDAPAQLAEFSNDAVPEFPYAVPPVRIQGKTRIAEFTKLVEDLLAIVHTFSCRLQVKVTRIAYSRDLNAGKYGRLAEQARLLGRVRSRVWRQYGSIVGVGVSDRTIRDQWMRRHRRRVRRADQRLERDRPGRRR